MLLKYTISIITFLILAIVSFATSFYFKSLSFDHIKRGSDPEAVRNALANQMYCIIIAGFFLILLFITLILLQWDLKKRPSDTKKKNLQKH